MNIPLVLDTIKTTDNFKAQVDLLTSLCLAFRTKGSRDMVVTSIVIYETAHGILSQQGTGEDTVRVLGFLTALLRATVADAASGAARLARELLRASGCLWDMTSMFLGTMMMYEETWKALCECLTESFAECEDNQNYCSRLIPTCIQRYQVRNSEITKVLLGLLMHNGRNIQIFNDSNGLSIFTRQTVQDRSTMELLATVAHNPAAANLLRRDTELMKFLLTFEDYSQGPLTQGPLMVEWAAVIMLNIASHIEGVETMCDSAERDCNTTDTNATQHTKPSSSDLTVTFLFKENWDIVKNTLDSPFNDIKLTNCLSDDQSSLEQSSIDLSPENKFAPTYVSTPKRKPKTASASTVSELRRVHKSNELQKINNRQTRHSWANNATPAIRQKLSTSARLFNIVNHSFASLYKTVGNIIFNNSVNARTQEDVPKINLKSDNNLSGPKLQGTVDIKQKLRKDVVRKLKIGMYTYGCNFKKISQIMWPQEKNMTPQVLYSIYRKYKVKKQQATYPHTIRKNTHKYR